MSKMSELQMDIIELYEDGFGLGEIADRLNCPIEIVDCTVNDFLEDQSEYYDDPMDGDAGSALASAGWGTDEDYGFYGDDYLDQ